jgi:hypothetical protein
VDANRRNEKKRTLDLLNTISLLQGVLLLLVICVLGLYMIT